VKTLTLRRKEDAESAEIFADFAEVHIAPSARVTCILALGGKPVFIRQGFPASGSGRAAPMTRRSVNSLSSVGLLTLGAAPFDSFRNSFQLSVAGVLIENQRHTAYVK
jgi:hypothetical protein